MPENKGNFCHYPLLLQILKKIWTSALLNEGLECQWVIDVQMVCRFKEPTLTTPKEVDLDACILFVFLSKDYLDLKDFILFLCLENFWILCLIKRLTLNDERNLSLCLRIIFGFLSKDYLDLKDCFCLCFNKNPLNPQILRIKSVFVSNVSIPWIPKSLDGNTKSTKMQRYVHKILL